MEFVLVNVSVIFVSSFFPIHCLSVASGANKMAQHNIPTVYNIPPSVPKESGLFKVYKMAITPNYEYIRSKKLRINVKASATIYKNPVQYQSSGTAYQATDYMRWYKAGRYMTWDWWWRVVASERQDGSRTRQLRHKVTAAVLKLSLRAKEGATDKDNCIKGCSWQHVKEVVTILETEDLFTAFIAVCYDCPIADETYPEKEFVKHAPVYNRDGLVAMTGYLRKVEKWLT